ncbi:MAG: alkaline phosphatase family protein [Anaerolineae bacterium]
MRSANEIEDTLRHHRFPVLKEQLPSDEFVMPHYEGLSIANLPATIAALLGANLLNASPPLPADLWADMAPGVRRVVLVLLDAIGYLRFRRLLEADESLSFAHLVRRGRLIPLTSVFPSTTTTALATLWTGRTPAEHGLLGYALHLQEYGVVADMLSLKPMRGQGRETLVDWGLEPEKFLPVPGLAELLAPHGITCRLLIHQQYADSPLSQMFHRGVTEKRGFVSSSDMWVSIRHLLAQHRDERLLLTAYWGGVDGVAHMYGPTAETWPAEIRNVAFSLEREFLRPLPPADREGTLLLITADHGQVLAPPEKAVLLTKHPSLWRALALPPSGDSRATYLHARHGQAEVVRAYLEEQLAGHFVVLDSKEALEAGLLGKGEMAPETPSRIGDLIALARGEASLHWGYKEPKLRGRHGGLTPEEMLVPLLMVRLDE